MKVDSFHIESHSGNRCDIFVEFQLVEDRRFARCVQTKHGNSSLNWAKKLFSKHRQKYSHFETFVTELKLGLKNIFIKGTMSKTPRKFWKADEIFNAFMMSHESILITNRHRNTIKSEIKTMNDDRMYTLFETLNMNNSFLNDEIFENVSNM